MIIIKEFLQIIHLIYIQFKMIFPYWFIGVLIGSVFSVFLTERITGLVEKLNTKKFHLTGALFASVLGAASPICMYGTVPLIATFGKKGTPQYLLTAFMVTSILINPNLFIFSFALGTPIALLRLGACLLAGVTAGILVYIFYSKKKFFFFDDFEDRRSKIKPHTLQGFLKDVHKSITITAPYFLFGMLITALFQRYVPKMLFINLFGSNKELGVLLAVTLGVPMYVCGGGTIPLLRSWLDIGMSPGAAIGFALSGASTKLTNLSAVKIILGVKNFLAYVIFNIVFALVVGWLIDLFY